MKYKFLILTAVWVAALLPPTPGMAQEPPNDPMPRFNRSSFPGFSSVPFSFLPPGARALGMGGAFIAIADDATASEANPAGLTSLTKPEVSLHGRRASFDIEADDLNARLAIDLIEAFTPLPEPFADSRVALRGTTSSASFASFVKPFKNWVFSIYYQETSNFEGRSLFEAVDTTFRDFYVSRKSIGVSSENIGLSGAFKIGKLSLGASIRQGSLEVDSFEELRIDYFNDLENFTGNFDHVDFFAFQDVIEDSDEDLTFNAGLLYNAGGKVSLGLIYKEGGRFQLEKQEIDLFCVDLPQFGFTCDQRNFQGTTAFRDVAIETVNFDLPDLIGLGIAFRPKERLTIAIDLNHITYSDLESGLLQTADPGSVAA